MHHAYACHIRLGFLVCFSSMLLLLTLDCVFRVVAGRGGALSVHGATGSRLDGKEGFAQ